MSPVSATGILVGLTLQLFILSLRDRNFEVVDTSAGGNNYQCKTLAMALATHVMPIAIELTLVIPMSNPLFIVNYVRAGLGTSVKQSWV